MSPVPSEKPGLQAERTQLAWERTGLVFLVGGALGLIGRDAPAVGNVVLAVVGVLLALSVVWLGHRRGRRIGDVPRFEVLFIGWATAGFAALIAMFVLR